MDAFAKGKKDSVLAALDDKIDWFETDMGGNTFLHWASIHGWNDVVVKLLAYTRMDSSSYLKKSNHNLLGKEKDAVTNRQNLAGKTPLHFAVEGIFTDIVETLISSGASISFIDSDGKSPKDYADPSNEYLIETLDVLIKPPLMDEVSKESPDINTVARLLPQMDMGALSTDSFRNTLLHWLSRFSNATNLVCSYAWQKGYTGEETISDEDIRPLREVTWVLITYNGDQITFTSTNDNDDRAFGAYTPWLSVSNKIVITPTIRMDVLFPNMFGDTPLHVAAKHGNAPMIVTLLKLGASASQKNKRGELPSALVPKKAMISQHLLTQAENLSTYNEIFVGLEDVD